MERPGTAGARNSPGLSEAPGHSRHTSRSIGAITSSVVSSLVWNVAWGLAWGSLMAAIYCAIGLALRLVRGPHFLKGYGLPFGTLGLIYLEGGVGAGFVLGLFRPLLRWRAGAIGIGTFAGTIAYGAIAIAMSGPIAGWGAGDWIVLLCLGVGVGGSLGNVTWEQYVDPTLPRPELPPGPPPPSPPLGMWRP